MNVTSFVDRALSLSHDKEESLFINIRMSGLEAQGTIIAKRPANTPCHLGKKKGRIQEVGNAPRIGCKPRAYKDPVSVCIKRAVKLFSE